MEIKLNGIEIHIVLKMNVYVVRGLNESNLKLTHFIKKFCQTQRKFLKNVSILRALIWASYIIEIYFQCKMMLNAILVASKEFHWAVITLSTFVGQVKTAQIFKFCFKACRHRIRKSWLTSGINNSVPLRDINLISKA